MADSSTIGERVAALESSMASLTRHVDKIALGIDKLIESEIRNNRTPWATLIATMSLVCLLVSSIGAAWIAPLEIRIQELQKRQDRVGDMVKKILEQKRTGE